MEIRLTLISAATATQSPKITKLKNLINAGFNPFNREELSLIPTACVYKPRLVNFITSPITIIHATAIKNGVGIGIPGIKPPKYPNDGSLITGKHCVRDFWESVMAVWLMESAVTAVVTHGQP